MSITLHMVSSLDGFIARKDNSVSWMDSSAWGAFPSGKELTDEVVAEFLSRIDCYVMGSRTYEHALSLGWAYGETPVTVVSRRALSSERASVSFYSGELAALARSFSNRRAWLVGGAELGQSFFKLGLVDEVCLTVAPILLGDGVPLFRGGEHQLRLKESTPYRNGMVDMWYSVVK